MQQDGTVRAIFFDFGGVVARLDRQLLADIEARHGLPEGSMLKALYSTPEWQAVEVGEGSEEEWVEAALRKLREFADRPLPNIRGEWATMWAQLDEDVLRLIERLRPRYNVGLISNSTGRLEGQLRDHHKIDGLFRVIVNSYRVGIAKPDTRIFQLAAERMGAEPSACVHIDDLVHNVEGARQAGFQAIHHKGDYAALERELRSLGVRW